MIDEYVSPSRRYVLFFEDTLAPGRERMKDLTLEETYPNNTNGARSQYVDRYGPFDKILRILPREAQVAKMQEKEKNQAIKYYKFSFPGEETMKDEDRAWVVFVKDTSEHSSKEHAYRIDLPGSGANVRSEVEAYFRVTFDKWAVITSCVEYAKCSEKVRANLEDPYAFPHKNYTVPDRKPVLTNQPLPYDQAKLIKDVKNLLGDYYGKNPYLMTDTEALNLLKKMKDDNMNYVVTLATINRTLKAGMPGGQK